MNWFRPFLTLLSVAGAMAAFYAALHLPFRAQNEALSKKAGQLREEIFHIQTRVDEMETSAQVSELSDDFFWQTASKADAELLLQKTAIELATASGLKAVTFGNSRTPHETLNQVVSFSIETLGPLEGAYRFLSELETLVPLVAVDNIRIRPGNNAVSASEGTLVYLQVNLWLYRRDST